MASFPWDKTEPGQGFFVPCLDLEKMRRVGLMAATPHRIRADGVPGIYKGRLGIWFFRKPDPQPRAGDAPAGSPSA